MVVVGVVVLVVVVLGLAVELPLLRKTVRRVVVDASVVPVVVVVGASVAILDAVDVLVRKNE